MARLFFYVPFPRTVVIGDIRENADQVAGSGIGNALAGATVVMVFKGEESQHQIGNADYVCVHAHGGSDSDEETFTAVTNNQGNKTSLAVLNRGLTRMGAANAIACYFFVCFSAQNGHAAEQWKANNPGQVVHGCTGLAQGAVVRTTRSGTVINSIFHAGNGQLSVIP